MSTVTDELALLRESVAGALEQEWDSPLIAGEPEAAEVLERVWQLAATQEWTSVYEEAGFTGLFAAVEELGRAACPLPLVDVFVAIRCIGADTELATSIREATVRPVVAVADEAGSVRCLDATAATHVLVLPLTAGTAELRAIIGRTTRAGVAMPPWSEVTLGDAIATAEVDSSRMDKLKLVMQLGLAVRAVAAAARTSELAVEHAKVRYAFGKPIGSFQAVSHRCANNALDTVAFTRLVDEAVRLHDVHDSAWTLAGDIAVAYGREAAPRIQYNAQHSFGAIGFFEEHEAPWLFRRVEADAFRIPEFDPTTGEVADVLLETGSGLPRLDLGDVAEALRHEVRAFLEEHPPARVGLEADGALTSKLADRGWLSLNWPSAYGGRDASVEELMALNEELAYADADTTALGSALLIGGAILRHGTAEQKERFLPRIAQGQLPFYLGYSEPEVGSDLANLRTKAERDGDDWVINGQKSWGTGAHRAEYCWLAARTDPDASRPHAGITVFLFEVPREGWECQQHRGLSGEISCTTFFDDVRVPDSARIGEVNGGWKVITDALASERTVMGGVSATIHRLFDDLVTELRARPELAGPRGSAVRRRITQLATRLQANRTLVNASVRATEAGTGARLEAPMAKIVGGELYEELCQAAIELLGPTAALADGPDVIARGAFGYGLRMSIMYVVGGGTNDIQRNLIARSLGLPR